MHILEIWALTRGGGPTPALEAFCHIAGLGNTAGWSWGLGAGALRQEIEGPEEVRLGKTCFLDR